MDVSPRGRFGGTACEATLWESDSGVRCGMAQGVGLDRQVILSRERERDFVIDSLSRKRDFIDILSK